MINLIEELKGCSTIAISGHIRPDGDCIGSVMGMYLYLKKVMPKAQIIPMIEEPSQEFACIFGIEDICSSFLPGVDRFDAFIGLDSSTPDRYGDALKYFETAEKTIIIDHHISNEGFGDVSYIDGYASSASELVYDLIDKDKLDVEIAKALYIGIVHDTGVFQYSCTSPKTLRAVAELIGFGFDFSAIIDNTFYEKTRIQNTMLGHALVNSIMLLDGKCIASGFDKKTMEKYGATFRDFDGIVNQLRYTKGVEVSIFMYEITEGNYKISLRSAGKVDVAVIAKSFDGGGHARAAGFNLDGEFMNCVDKVVKEIEKQL